METNELRLFSRYYEEFGIDKKTGESNLTQIYLEVKWLSGRRPSQFFFTNTTCNRNFQVKEKETSHW